MAIDKSKLVPTGMVYSRTGKLPLENDRLFDTLALAQAYVDDADQTAYVGLTVSVVADTEDKNGLYYVKAVGTADAAGVLEKVGADLGDVTGDISNLQTEVAGVKGSVESLSSEMTQAKTDIQGLQSASATKDELAGVKSELEGSISGAKSDLQAKIDANAQAIEALNAATTFGGTGTYEQMQALADVKAGTVWVISGDEAYANKEFVYDGSNWVELGDTSAEAQRISTLEGEMSQAKTDISGLQASLSTKVEAEDGKGLSANDFTNDLKAKLEGIAEGAQVNVLEGVQVDGVDLTVTDKKVNIDLSAFAKSSDVQSDIQSAVDGINTSLAAKLDKTATVNGKEFGESQAVVVGSGDIKLTSNIGTDKQADRYTTDDSIQGVLENMNARIESIDADIQSALEGGVTGIEMGNGISVDSTTATKPKVSIKLAAVNPGLQATAEGLAAKVAEGTALKVDENGLGIYWESL